MLDYEREVNRYWLIYIDSLLQNEKLFATNKALYLLSFLASQTTGDLRFTVKNPTLLSPNPAQTEQVELNQQISDFWHSGFGTVMYNPSLRRFWEREGFPIPEFSMLIISQTRPEKFTQPFFSPEDFSKLQELKGKREFLNALKTEKANCINFITTLEVRLTIGLQAMKAIQKYRPDVKAEFEKLGIVGDGIGNWDKSVPMKRKPGTECTCQLDTTLKQSYIKFRTHNT